MPSLKLSIIRERTADAKIPSFADAPGVYVWRDVAGRACAYGHTVDGRHWLHWPGLASYGFDDSSSDVIAYPAPTAAAEIVVDTFNRMVMPLALQRHGLEALHASAVIIAGRVVAFCATSGTGKSTLAYALARLRGYSQWSDDAVVFEVGRNAITAVPLPFDVRLRPESAAELTPQDRFAARVIHEEDARQPTPLGAVCILVRRDRHGFGEDAEVVRVSGSKALASVLEHAHTFDLIDPMRKKRMLEHYLDLIERVPIYEIRFRSGFHRLRSVVERVSSALEQ